MVFSTGEALRKFYLLGKISVRARLRLVCCLSGTQRCPTKIPFKDSSSSWS